MPRKTTDPDPVALIDRGLEPVIVTFMVTFPEPATRMTLFVALPNPIERVLDPVVFWFIVKPYELLLLIIILAIESIVAPEMVSGWSTADEELDPSVIDAVRAEVISIAPTVVIALVIPIVFAGTELVLETAPN